DGTGKPANGRSLMKVVALGVKKGHRSVRGSAGVAGPDVHPSWQQYRLPRTLPDRHPR
ncbi:hypothetical protein ACUODJ_47750, partial [Escherichia sp. HC-CC]